MLYVYVLNHDFGFFAFQTITKFYRGVHFGMPTLIYQVNLHQVAILFVARNQY